MITTSIIMFEFRKRQLYCVSPEAIAKGGCRVPTVNYSKVQTGGNNPQVSQKIRYSQLVGTGFKQRTIHMSNGQEIGLQQRIIVPLTN